MTFKQIKGCRQLISAKGSQGARASSTLSSTDDNHWALSPLVKLYVEVASACTSPKKAHKGKGTILDASP